jgi:hypothetical protein
MIKNRKNLTSYIAAYISEAVARGNPITYETIEDALDAFEGGACDCNMYSVKVTQETKLLDDTVLGIG